MPHILTHIVEQHAEEAAFLWLLRDKAVDAPHYKRHHLARLDERVEAHVDGLRVAGEAGREIAWSQLQQWGEMGEMFAAAVTLVGTGNPDLVAPCIDFAERHPESLRGLVGAIAWADPARLGSLVQTWLDSDRPLERYLSVAACSVHRVDPHEWLGLLVEDNEPKVRARALRLAGELGRADLTDNLARIMDADADCTNQFWAAWSLALLTHSPRAIVQLQNVALGSGPKATRAFDLALRALQLEDAKAWLRMINGDFTRARHVVIGLGVTGDPAAVPWLIERMRSPSLARLAGESFSMITGVDLAHQDLNAVVPNSFEAGPTGEPLDENVSLDPDENLPWPNPSKIEEWWTKHAPSYSLDGQRYLLGAKVSREACSQVWAHGFQRQRRAVAFEHARLHPEHGLMEWRMSNTQLTSQKFSEIRLKYR